MQAPFDQLFNAAPLAVILPQIVNTGGGEVEGQVALSGVAGSLGSQGAAFAISVGASADTLNSTNKFTITVLEGDEADGSDAALVTEAAAIFSNHGAGLNAQGGAFASGVAAVIDHADEDSLVYQIAYCGKKPVVTLRITPAGTHTTGTPFSVVAFPISLRRQGAATRL